MSQKLEINITRAALQSFNVSLDEKKPNVTATIALLTEGGKAITTYTIRTEAWDAKDKFDLPVNCIGPIIDICRQLEEVVTKHCRDSQLGLPAGQAKSDEPINLDDIPF